MDTKPEQACVHFLKQLLAQSFRHTAAENKPAHIQRIGQIGNGDRQRIGTETSVRSRSTP